MLRVKMGGDVVVKSVAKMASGRVVLGSSKNTQLFKVYFQSLNCSADLITTICGGGMITKLVFSGCILMGCLGVAEAQDNFTNWPAGTSPQEVGKQLADHFVTSPHQYTKTIHYSEICTWYGALRFANLTHDDALRDQLIKRFEPLMPGGAEAERRPVRRHVDDSIFGVAPLEIARQTKDPKFLKEGLWRADRQWERPQPDGLSAETRYWIAAMCMLPTRQLKAYRVHGDRMHADPLAKT